MKIYVSLPLNYNTNDFKSFTNAVSVLKRLGHNVVDSSEIKSKDATKLFNSSEKAIKDTDVVIAEVSKSDSKVGYEIARAFSEKKIVIALESDKGKSETNPIIHGNKSRSLVYKKYSDKNAEDVVQKALKEAASKLDSKFILIISPEIDRYLDWASQNKRMHKAQIVRNALETIIKKDKDYRNYIQG